MLEVVFENEHIIAINKPHGLLVHRSSIAKDEKEFAVQLLRDQVGYHVYPPHRLDRKTSGVLLFAKDRDYLKQLHNLFLENKMEKTYRAIVRGFTPNEETIDYAITNESGKKQEAITEFKTLERYEIDLPFGKHASSRYSLVELYPKTGRFHQLRKHMAHISHPILGDRPHGCNKQNKLWKERFQMDKMLLHAKKLSFTLEEDIFIEAEESKTFKEVQHLLETKLI